VSSKNKNLLLFIRRIVVTYQHICVQRFFLSWTNEIGINLFRTAQQTRQDDVATPLALRGQYATITPRRRNAPAMLLGNKE